MKLFKAFAQGAARGLVAGAVIAAVSYAIASALGLPTWGYLTLCALCLVVYEALATEKEVKAAYEKGKQEAHEAGKQRAEVPQKAK